MTTITAKPVREKPTRPVSLPEEQHLYLPGVRWENYLAIGNALPDRPGLRLTYDGENLELMVTSPRHEIYKKWLGRFIEVLVEEHGLRVAPGGNMTFQNENLAKGIEADDCFWIEHELAMRGKFSWDLKVPEVWSFDGTTIQVRCLQQDGTYYLKDKSSIFPQIPIAEIVRFLDPQPGTDYLSAVREFRTWLRQILGKPPSP